MTANTTTLRCLMAEHQMGKPLGDIVKMCRRRKIPLDVVGQGNRYKKYIIMEKDAQRIIRYYNEYNLSGATSVPTDNEL